MAIASSGPGTDQTRTDANLENHLSTNATHDSEGASASQPSGLGHAMGLNTECATGVTPQSQNQGDTSVSTQTVERDEAGLSAENSLPTPTSLSLGSTEPSSFGLSADTSGLPGNQGVRIPSAAVSTLTNNNLSVTDDEDYDEVDGAAVSTAAAAAEKPAVTDNDLGACRAEAEGETNRLRHSSSSSSSGNVDSDGDNDVTIGHNTHDNDAAGGLTKKQRKRLRQKQKKQKEQEKLDLLQQQSNKSGKSFSNKTTYKDDEMNLQKMIKEANEQLMEENERLSLNCRVCMDEMIGVMLLPCSHSAVCTSCSHKLLQCPICRSDIQNSMHVFMVT